MFSFIDVNDIKKITVALGKIKLKIFLNKLVMHIFKKLRKGDTLGKKHGPVAGALSLAVGRGWGKSSPRAPCPTQHQDVQLLRGPSREHGLFQ